MRHCPRRDDELIAHVIGYGPANDPARVFIPDGALVGKAITAMQIRNITGPDHVYPCRSEHSLDQVAGIDPLALCDRGFHDERPGT